MIRMLVKFAIDPQTLHKEAKPLQFERLVEKWENLGVLVNADEIEDRLDSLDSLDQNIRIQLEKIFKGDNPPSPRRYRFLDDDAPQVNWETLDDSNIGRLGAWGDVFELAVLNNELAHFIGALDSPLSTDKRQAMCGSVEPIGLAIADRARAFTQAYSISRRGFEEGDEHETLWSERFSRLTEFSSQIIIIDAYALHKRQISGFIKLLELIDRDAESCRVTLFSFPDSDNDEAVKDIRELLNEAVSGLDGGGVQQVTVRFFPSDDTEISKLLHDRRIRFDRSVYAPENSIALVFSGDEGAVPQKIGCTLRLSDDEYHPFDDMKKTENELLKKAQGLKWLATEQDFMVIHPGIHSP